MLQSREGFIWAGTKSGLNRFDGRVCKVFTSAPDDSGSISNSQIWAIAEVGDFIVVGGDGGALDFFNKKTQRSLHLPLSEKAVQKTPFVQNILVDASGHLWVLAGSEGNVRLFVVRISPNFWQELSENAALLGTLKLQQIGPANIISAAMTDSGKTICVDANTGFFAIRAETAAVQSFPDAPGCPHVPLDFRSNLRTDPQGAVWFVWKNNLQRFDGRRFEVFPLNFSFEAFVGIAKNGNALFWTGKNLLAFSLDSLRAGGEFRQSATDFTAPMPKRPTCLETDRSGILWFGTDGLGMVKIRPSKGGRLQHLFKGNSVYGSLFYENNGTIGYLAPNGLFVFPENGDGPLCKIARRSDVETLGLWRTAMDRQGVRWLFARMKTGRQYLFRVLGDGQTEAFDLPVKISNKRGNIGCDPADGSVWLAWPGVLLHFDPKTKDWQHFPFNDLIPFDTEVCAVQPMPDGRVWIGSAQGLVEARPDGGGGCVFKIHRQEAGNLQSLRHNRVSSLLPDPDDADLLWVGTKGGGLSRLDTRTGQFLHHHTRNGFPDDVIYGLLWSGLSSPPLNGLESPQYLWSGLSSPPLNGLESPCYLWSGLSSPPGRGLESPQYLWASSNKGIIRLHPKTGEIQNFTEANGLQSNEFNTWAFAAGPAGSLMFGGIEGLNVFDPAYFSNNPNVPQVWVTDLKINNLPIFPGDSTGVLPQAIEFSKRIKLAFDQRNLSLEFAALEFNTPAKNRFRWILEGAENTWHPETEQNNATYLNLSPGRYTFKIMAANADGVWNPQPAVLEIVVSPPWWRSWWAYLIYIGVLAAAARAFFDFQTKRRLEQSENRMLRELDAFKSRLYVNITHEFRTPLTVILGNLETQKSELEKLAEPGQAGPFAQFLSQNEASKRNAENLLRLINQMLDLAKLEDKSLRLNLRRGDAVAYLKYVLESFQSLAQARNLNLRFDSTLENFDMDFDPERLAQVINNLIFNALKHTLPGGSIFLNLKNPANDRLEIEVRDTGTGIPAADLPHIFERFFQAGNAAGGTGIGLALTRELVKLFGGEIRVESRTEGENRGTAFSVSLPVTRLAEPLVQTVFGNIKNAPTENFGLEKTPGDFQAQNSAADDPQKPELLLVEDNADVADFLRTLLEPNYRVRTAPNGRIGMETAFETVPDMVVTDLMMPEMDGLQLCEALKNDPRTSHIPVVLLTARAAVEDRVAGLERGADAYLVKPVNRAELLTTLSNLLENRKKLRARYASPTPVLPPTDDPDLQIEDAFLQKLRGFVESKLDKSDLTAEEICRAMGMSHPVIHRKITALTGRSLMLFVRSVRLGHASLLLKNAPEKTVAEIAYEVGFNDPKFFSRVFSEEFGVSPTKSRK